MGIQDRDYWQKATGDYEAEKPEHERKTPWTTKRVLAWVGGGLLLAALIALAILGHSR